MTAPTQAPPAVDLLRGLADAGIPHPAEVLLGELTHPVRLDDAGTGRSLAVLSWRGNLHVLTYEHDGCPRCLCWFLTRQPPAEPADSTDIWPRLAPPHRVIVTRLAALLLSRHPAGTLATVDRATGQVHSGRVPPWSGCARCQGTMAATTVTFGHTPELLDKADGTLRSRRPLPPDLVADYVAPHSLFREPRVDLDGPVPAAQVGLPLPDGVLEPGIGRCRDFAASRRTAVLEGLERYTALHFRPTAGIVEATLAELGERAIDPRTLGYHDTDQYARDDFPYAPLHVDEPVRWVPVTPLGAGPARYLPEAALSWARTPGARKPLFYDTSNGFALGQSPEEATLHGILEVVERDAFLLTWYRKLLLPELMLGPADRELTDLVARVEFVTGFRVRLYWAALDTGIPVVLALARRDADEGPCTFVSTGAGLRPHAAAESAIFEVAAILSAVRHSFDDDLAHARRLAARHDLVRTMADHSLLGALPTSRAWFDFLTTPDRPELDLATAAASSPVFATLAEDLDHVRTRIEAAGSHVYAADVTTPELRWRGLVCTRAVVPGFLPMTFGHDTRRLDGLPRVHSGAFPYASRLPHGQTPADVPPHPFP